MSRILIVEDERKIARTLELELTHEGYEVDTAGDGRTGLEKALQEDVDLVLLDLMLPELSGIEVCRRLRRESDKPVIMLTAKDDVSDKVMGLDIGADDYMTKPFAIEELLARIRVALKKRQGREEKQSAVLQAGKLVLDPQSYTVTFDGENVALTKKEFDLLQYLMAHKGQVLSRDNLLENVWEYEFAGDSNTVDVYISYLRHKIDQPYNITTIQTVRAVGYKFIYG